MRAATITTGLLLLTGTLDPVWGQVVRGRLLDVVTNEPIAGGIVTLIAADGKRVTSVVTSADGVYRLSAPRPGTFLVEARRIGYRTWVDGPIELAAGDDWESEFRLPAIPQRLEAVDVPGEAVETEALLRRVGFYDRQRADFGHFITRKTIEARAATRVTELLSAIPGVHLIPGAGGLNRSGIELQGSLLSYGGSCHPRVFVDGIMVIRGDARPRGLDIHGLPEEPATETALPGAERPEIALDDVVQPEEIEAVEVYRRAAQVPARFGGTSTATQCGVIVIWTRRGRSPGP